MVEIANFLAKRVRRERKGWLNWPLGTPIPLGDIGRTRRRLFETEAQGTLGDLGIAYEEDPDPSPDQVDWQYSRDSGIELFVKGTSSDVNIPKWSSLGAGELGFSAKFGKRGSYRLVVPELRWNRIKTTPALMAALKQARRDGRIRRRDRIVMGVGVASSYTLLVSLSNESTIDFTASAAFSNIADASAGFQYKRSSGAVERYVANAGGTLFLKLMKVRWSGELNMLKRVSSVEDDDIQLVDAGIVEYDDVEDADDGAPSLV